MATKAYRAEINREAERYVYLKPNQILPSARTYRDSKVDEEGNYISLPRTLYEANMMYMKNINHPAMNMIGNSLKAHRSCNEAIIYLYGITGAGKSSTLNHLFNNRDDVIPVSNQISCTSEVCEYAWTMESDHWRVSNLQIGFIDTPGWDDSRAKDMDAYNFALMENFITTHPHLGCKALKIFPNIILIVINSIDNRMVGQNSKAAHMLRAVSQLNIVDTERPNVVFILSHASAIPERKYLEEIKGKKRLLKQLAREFLGIKAPVVMIENNYVDNNLEREGEWTLLRDGTKQPLNLFKAMMKLMGRSSDEVGIEAIRIFFGNRHMEGKMEKRHLVDEVRIDQKYIDKCKNKWSEELSKNLTLNTKTEVALILEKFVKERKEEICQECPTAQVDDVGFLNPLMRVLESYNISTLKELQRSYKQIRKQKKCPLNETENFILMSVLDVNIRLYPEALEVVGRGFEFFSEILAQNLIFNPAHSDKYIFNSILVKRVPMRYNVFLNNKLDVNYGRSTLIRSDCISIANVRKYRDNDVIIDPDNPQEFYFGVEEYLYTISLDFKILNLNSEFCRDVNLLPDVWEHSNGELILKFQEFFANYGYWIIIKGSAGGFLQGQFKPKNPRMPKKDIKVGIEGYIEQLKNVSKEWHDSEKDFSYGMMKGIEDSAIQWLGGSTEGLPNKLGALTSEQYLGWLDSLSDQPIIFEHSLTTVPIYIFANLVNEEKGELIKNAFKKMHPDSENYTFNKSDLDISNLAASVPQKLRSKLSKNYSKPPESSKEVHLANFDIQCESMTTPGDIDQPSDASTGRNMKTSQSEDNLVTKKVPVKPPRITNPKPKPSISENKLSDLMCTVVKDSTSIQATPDKKSKKFPQPPPKPLRKPLPNMSHSLNTEKLSFDSHDITPKNNLEGEILEDSMRPLPSPRQSFLKQNLKNVLEKQLSPLTPLTPSTLPHSLPPTLNLYPEDDGEEGDQRPVPAPRGGKSQTVVMKKTPGGNRPVLATAASMSVIRSRDEPEIQPVAECDDNPPIEGKGKINKDTRDGQTELSKRDTSDGCFPATATVVVQGGRKISMSELKIGDSVLSIDKKTFKPRYSKVYMWVHLNVAVKGEFIQIHYRGGVLSITPRHLLLCRQHHDSSDSAAQLIPAERVGPGDIVYSVRDTPDNEGDRTRVDELRVLNVSHNTAMGFYCPATYNSMIVVDGVACSVWSLPSQSTGDVTHCHQLAHGLFYPFRMAHRMGMGHICNNKLDVSSGKHRYSILLENVYKKMPIVKKQ